MKVVIKILASCGMLASAGGAVIAAAFAFAAAANSSPEQLLGVYLAIGASALLAVLGAVVALMLLKSGKAALAALAAFAPLPLMVAAVFLLLK